MKKILVPTDFSSNAENALHYAIQLANQFEAEIEILHAYDTIATTGSLINVADYFRENAEKDLTRTIKKFKEHLNYGTKLSGRVIPANPVDAIIGAGHSKDFDLIVMGTKGASGIKGVIFGSTTEEVMQKVDAPLLAIPTDFKYRKPKEIALSLDAQEIEEDRATFKPLLELLDSFAARLAIVHVLTEKNYTDFDHDIVNLIKEQHITYFTYKLDGRKHHVNRLLNEFTNAYPTDMICMVRRKKGFWNRLFLKSMTSEEIFNCPLPLLILRDRD